MRGSSVIIFMLQNVEGSIHQRMSEPCLGYTLSMEALPYAPSIHTSSISPEQGDNSEEPALCIGVALGLFLHAIKPVQIKTNQFRISVLEDYT